MLLFHRTGTSRSGRPSRYFADWISTPVRVVPAMRLLEDELPDGHAASRSEVDLVGVLPRPSGCLQLPVDLDPGAGLGC
jgi:hypothetical protein